MSLLNLKSSLIGQNLLILAFLLSTAFLKTQWLPGVIEYTSERFILELWLANLMIVITHWCQRL